MAAASNIALQGTSKTIRLFCGPCSCPVFRTRLHIGSPYPQSPLINSLCFFTLTPFIQIHALSILRRPSIHQAELCCCWSHILRGFLWATDEFSCVGLLRGQTVTMDLRATATATGPRHRRKSRATSLIFSSVQASRTEICQGASHLRYPLGMRHPPTVSMPDPH